MQNNSPAFHLALTITAILAACSSQSTKPITQPASTTINPATQPTLSADLSTPIPAPVTNQLKLGGKNPPRHRNLRQQPIPHSQRQTLDPRNGRIPLRPLPTSRMGRRNPKNESRRNHRRLHLRHMDLSRRNPRPIRLDRRPRPPPFPTTLRQARLIRLRPHRSLVPRRSPQRRPTRLAPPKIQNHPPRRPNFHALHRPLLRTNPKTTRRPPLQRRRPSDRHPTRQ